jgi:hypothetical protein
MLNPRHSYEIRSPGQLVGGADSEDEWDGPGPAHALHPPAMPTQSVQFLIALYDLKRV